MELLSFLLFSRPVCSGLLFNLYSLITWVIDRLVPWITSIK